MYLVVLYVYRYSLPFVIDEKMENESSFNKTSEQIFIHRDSIYY